MKPLGALFVCRFVQLLAREIAAASLTLSPAVAPSYFQLSPRFNLTALTPRVSPCRNILRVAHCEKSSAANRRGRF